MREILFRGKTTDKGDWEYGSPINLDADSGYTYICPEYSCASSLSPFELIEVSSERVIPETVSEWTGLYDQNGVRIFEGDILIAEWDDARGQEYFAVARYGEFNCSCCEGVYGFTFDNGDIRRYENYKVVGNLWDNPELLKGE